ncbi:TDP-N-acetylfucosamine:lipid II N-acetylfucosaminyltransferase [Clostridium cibarium]|uniref:TDP-N-acetylfucosamine:lipid II N-acetylfucosaminyltransferase n=1 Tax=Clostridium cibarium TaxID=2762247 RepID=A0ABR8PUE2_9CLOT|nr:TDP-N-acetylfucosamine:lipid II N-acetylfucosaminyltransferase [Clostridium cibarium]MBD7911777.1 TDP-N-acetylfucosamine:lipid II N-acetylfucosaminyltransferase [Clostridium cibarium]
MNIHIFPHEKFTASFIEMINKNFESNDHIFLVFKKAEYLTKDKSFDYDNVFFYNSEKDVILHLNKIPGKKKLILHSLFWGKDLFLYFISNMRLLKNSYWVLWGADLYNYLMNSRYNKWEILRRMIIKRIGNIITYVEGDYILAKKWYKTKAIYYSGFYPYLIDTELINSKHKVKLSREKIAIQIGNSADPSNNHIEIIDYLSKYKDKNIEVICPLAYGDKEYTKDVIQHGKKVLGNKFNEQVKFLSYEEYVNSLNDIDIAIFNHKRQQAMGNILTLLYMGKKVYIRDDISTWSFLKSININVFEISGIKKEDEFFSLIDECKTNENRNILEVEFSNKKFISDWSKVFFSDKY